MNPLFIIYPNTIKPIDIRDANCDETFLLTLLCENICISKLFVIYHCNNEINFMIYIPCVAICVGACQLLDIHIIPIEASII